MTNPRPKSIYDALTGTFPDSPGVEEYADLPGRPTSVDQAARRLFGVPGCYPITEGQPTDPTPTEGDQP